MLTLGFGAFGLVERVIHDPPVGTGLAQDPELAAEPSDRRVRLEHGERPRGVGLRGGQVAFFDDAVDMQFALEG
jgi:hypothetical protein